MIFVYEAQTSLSIIRKCTPAVLEGIGRSRLIAHLIDLLIPISYCCGILQILAVLCRNNNPNVGAGTESVERALSRQKYKRVQSQFGNILFY